jgi:lipopolysaccharide/colanic/teichoic acid biosynthesis glycosyltransferase
MKRLLDIVIAAAALVIWVLPALVISLAVRIDVGKPILFVQLRPGRHGVPFRLVKFRTMRNAYDANGRLLPPEERLTRLGRFLRATSLDELPELWNVLRGDMSLVGPRPLMMEYLPLYNAEQARRHAVRPGLTGWAQVNGRNMITWEEKFAFDVWYVDHQSLLLDLKILWRTLIKVLAAEGISPPDREIMEPFSGSPGSPPGAAKNDR